MTAPKFNSGDWVWTPMLNAGGVFQSVQVCVKERVLKDLGGGQNYILRIGGVTVPFAVDREPVYAYLVQLEASATIELQEGRLFTWEKDANDLARTLNGMGGLRDGA